MISNKDEQKILAALEKIDSDSTRPEWLRVGMALKHEGFDFSVFDDWSRGGSKYNQKDTEAQWKSLRNPSGNPVTGGTIIWLASQNGFDEQKWFEDWIQTDEGKAYLKEAPPSEQPKSIDKKYKHIHNAAAVGNDKDILFVFSKKTDADFYSKLININAVSIDKDSGAAELLALIEETRSQQRIIIKLESEKAAAEISKALKQKGVKHIVSNPSEQALTIEKIDDIKAEADKEAADLKEASIPKFSFITAEALTSKEFKPLEWVIEGLLPREGLAFLSSIPKLGKSWLALQLAIEVSSGGTMFDRQLEKGTVLYLALEDSERRLKSRINMLIPDRMKPSNLLLSIEEKAKLDGGFEFPEKLKELKKAYPDLRLVIVDTFAMLLGSAKGKEQEYQFYTRILEPSRAAARELGICLLLVHHNNKPSKDAMKDSFNKMNGSVAIQGMADTMWVMNGNRNKDSIVSLSVIGKDIEMQDYVIEQDENTRAWNIVGDLEEIREAQAKKEAAERHKKEESSFEASGIPRTIDKQLSRIEESEEPDKRYIVTMTELRNDILSEINLPPEINGVSLQGKALATVVNNMSNYLLENYDIDTEAPEVTWRPYNKDKSGKYYIFKRVNMGNKDNK